MPNTMRPREMLLTLAQADASTAAVRVTQFETPVPSFNRVVPVAAMASATKESAAKFWESTTFRPS